LFRTISPATSGLEPLQEPGRRADLEDADGRLLEPAGPVQSGEPDRPRESLTRVGGPINLEGMSPESRRRKTQARGSKLTPENARVLSLLRRYVRAFGWAGVSGGAVLDGVDLRKKVVYYRSRHRHGSLGPDLVRALEALPGWTWDPKGDCRRHLLEKAKEMLRCSGAPIRERTEEARVAAWMRLVRWDRRHGRVNPELVRALERLPGWRWDASREQGRDRIRSRKAARHLDVLRAYGRAGHDRLPPRAARTHEERAVNAAVVYFRHRLRIGNLPAASRRALEELPFAAADARVRSRGTLWRARPESPAVSRHVEAIRAWYRAGKTRMPHVHERHRGAAVGAAAQFLLVRRRRATLEEALVPELEAFPGWSWSQRADREERCLALLRSAGVPRRSTVSRNGRAPSSAVATAGCTTATRSSSASPEAPRRDDRRDGR
jgi:hypothetical protein